jgi:hypothetical protein
MESLSMKGRATPTGETMKQPRSTQVADVRRNLGDIRDKKPNGRKSACKMSCREDREEIQNNWGLNCAVELAVHVVLREVADTSDQNANTGKRLSS